MNIENENRNWKEIYLSGHIGYFHVITAIERGLNYARRGNQRKDWGLRHRQINDGASEFQIWYLPGRTAKDRKGAEMVTMPVFEFGVVLSGNSAECHIDFAQRLEQAVAEWNFADHCPIAVEKDVAEDVAEEVTEKVAEGVASREICRKVAHIVAKVFTDHVYKGDVQNSSGELIGEISATRANGQSQWKMIIMAIDGDESIEKARIMNHSIFDALREVRYLHNFDLHDTAPVTDPEPIQGLITNRLPEPPHEIRIDLPIRTHIAGADLVMEEIRKAA